MSEGEERLFHLGDILTITTGLLVSPRHVEGIYDILNFMTGDNLFTHQLPRAMDECAPVLLAQHPQLRAVQVPEEFDGKEHVDQWLAEQVMRYGEQLSVAPLHAGDHTVIDPISELRMMGVPPQRIIGIEVEEP
jgi:hypothetical protein